MNTNASESGDGLPWPRQGYAWYVVAILFVCSVFSFLDRQIIALMVEDIKLDLGICQRPLILEHAVLALRSVPGRHQAGIHLLGDRLGPGTGLVIVGESHRCDHSAEVGSAGAVANLAVALHDGQDILVEGR